MALDPKTGISTGFVQVEDSQFGPIYTFLTPTHRVLGKSYSLDTLIRNHNILKTKVLQWN
jgi:hypothetical protein